MGSLAKSFKQILSTLTHAPESEALEPQLADFASRIGAAGQTLIYCQLEVEILKNSTQSAQLITCLQCQPNASPNPKVSLSSLTAVPAPPLENVLDARHRHPKLFGQAVATQNP
jgi:hypothetical protein